MEEPFEEESIANAGYDRTEAQLVGSKSKLVDSGEADHWAGY